jgi:hypothetical protein
MLVRNAGSIRNTRRHDKEHHILQSNRRDNLKNPADVWLIMRSSRYKIHSDTQNPRVNLDSSVDIVTGLRTGRPEFDSRQGQEIFSSPQHSDRLWGPTSLLYNGHWRLFTWG